MIKPSIIIIIIYIMINILVYPCPYLHAALGLIMIFDDFLKCLIRLNFETSSSA